MQEGTEAAPALAANGATTAAAAPSSGGSALEPAPQYGRAVAEVLECLREIGSISMPLRLLAVTGAVAAVTPLTHHRVWHVRNLIASKYEGPSGMPFLLHMQLDCRRGHMVPVILPRFCGVRPTALWLTFGGAAGLQVPAISLLAGAALRQWRRSMARHLATLTQPHYVQDPQACLEQRLQGSSQRPLPAPDQPAPAAAACTAAAGAAAGAAAEEDAAGAAAAGAGAPSDTPAVPARSQPPQVSFHASVLLQLRPPLVAHASG